MSELPELPEGDGPPSVAALAERLASLVPADDRDEAYTALAERVLPPALAGVATHPRPRRLAQIVYQDLGERLEQAEPEDRLSEVERAVDESEFKELAAHAQSLAVARYLSDHPDATGDTGAFLDQDAQEWRSRGAEAIAQEATETKDALEAWADRVRDERGDLYETRRAEHLHADIALDSARSGAFGAAAGPLTDFLAAMGETPDRLDLH